MKQNKEREVETVKVRGSSEKAAAKMKRNEKKRKQGSDGVLLVRSIPYKHGS